MDAKKNLSQEPRNTEQETTDSQKCIPSPRLKGKDQFTVYFDYDPRDMPFITDLLEHQFPMAKLAFYEPIKQPCIMFSFVLVNARLDVEGWHQQAQVKLSQTGGNWVLVMVHNKALETSYNTSVELPSGLSMMDQRNSVPLILNALFETTFDQSGLGKNETALLDKAALVAKLRGAISQVNLGEESKTKKKSELSWYKSKPQE